MSAIIALAGYESIFNSGTPRNGESVQSIALAELHAPDPHPFMVLDDDAMAKLTESVREFGVREPGLARPLVDGGDYELLCGNRRKRACELAGLTEMPVT